MTESTQTEKPRLRLIDAQPLVYEGEAYLMLRDPLMLTDKTLLVPQPMIPALALIDGTRTTGGLRASLALRYGLFLTGERVREFLDALDDALLLDNERSRQARIEAQAAFRRADFRPPSSAGASYPEDPGELSQYLDRYIKSTPAQPDGDIRGLVSPHIDYERGAEVYAKVWGSAANAAREAELVIVFGTDHFSEGLPFSLTHQNYATPFGPLPTETAVIDELAEVIGREAAFAGELHHRREHSIELAAVWLHHVRGGSAIPLVPILVGSLETALEVEQGSLVEGVLRVLSKTIRSRRTLVVAAGDLAHVGPAFDTEPVDSGKLVQVKSADAELIDAMCRGDAEGFYTTIQRGQDANNVCGVSPIYYTLRLLAPLRGESLGYAVCPADQKRTSVVTICGVALHGG